MYLPFIDHLLQNIDALGEYVLPQLHRFDPDSEYPTIRVAARKDLSNITLEPPAGWSGTDGPDALLDGHAYAGWYWRPDSSDRYTFPTTIDTCKNGTNCATVILGDEGATQFDLCDSGNFTANGWSHTGDLTGGPQDECYWDFDGSGSSPWRLDSGKWGMDSMVDSRLMYSFRYSGTLQMKVFVSDNGFSNCSELTGTGCRVVAQYPHSTSVDGRGNGDYRTEILDVHDFDGAQDVQVRFEMGSASGGAEFEVYDVILVGWDGT